MLTVQIPTPPEPPAPPPPPELGSFVFQGGTSIWDNPALVATIVIVAALTIVLFPLMRALARRMERGPADAALHGELEELRARLGDVEAMQHRLADVEERLDFAERLLARGPEPGRLEREGA